MKDFSLQLYSLRDMKLVDALEVAADAGYTGVEFAGYENYSAAEISELLKKYNLKAVGSHISFELLKNDLDAVIEFSKAIGLETVCCPYYEMNSAAEAIECAKYLESCVDKFAEAGIALGYHNHAHEFGIEDGKTFIEHMMDNTEKLVFELDVFWVGYAGFDPIEFVKKHSDRISIFHYKELGEGEEKPNVELGNGIIDFKGLTKLGEEIGILHYIVEQEHYTMEPEDSVRVDADFMKTL